MNKKTKIKTRRTKINLGRSQWLFFLLLAFSPGLRAESQLQFRMEFSKPEIYVGEQVICNFVIYTPDDVVEVEVEKFPDYRGYWKDNLILRQGPIPATPSPNSSLHKAIVGSYLVIPMLGDLEPLIDPMKIVIRNPAAEASHEKQNIELVSEGVQPRIKKLPPMKNKSMSPFFTGAIGQFSLSTEKAIISFQKDEPTVLRISLAGEGNFQDINELPITFPKGIEVVSKRSSIQGGGQSFTKTFEYTLSPHLDKNFLLDPIHIVTFNPATSKYEALEIPALTFQRVVPEKTEETNDNAIRLGKLQTNFSIMHPWYTDACFLWVQIFLFGLLASFGAGRWILERRRSYQQSQEFDRKLRTKLALKAGRSGDVENFLKIAERLAFEKLADFLPEPSVALTRNQLLEKTKRNLPEGIWKCAERLFFAYDSFLFSPSKSLTDEMSTLVTALEELMARKKVT